MYQQPIPPTTPPTNPNQSAISRIFGSTTPVQRTIIAVVGALVVIVLLCCSCGTIAAIFDHPSGNVATSQQQPQQDTRATATATPKPTPKATPKATATPDANLSAPTYAQMVAQDAGTISDDMSVVGNSCGAGDLQQCYLDLSTLDGDLQIAQADVNANPAPPCMKTADTYWRKALSTYHQAAQDAMNGITDSDASEISIGTKLMQQGGTYVTQATAALKAAHC